MHPFQPRALRQVNNQGSYNQALKPINNNLKNNILGLKSLNLNSDNTANLAALKQKAANELNYGQQGGFSKIPVPSRSRIPIANSQENRVPELLFKKKSETALLKKAQPIAIPTPKPVIENIDADTNCFLLSDYVVDIYHYLREVEFKQRLEPNFLSIKNCVAPHMRSILINWIIQVHASFHMISETLYIAVSMIDRFFAREPVVKGRIQLVGITALFIASKYEEIYYPEITEFVAVCDKLYTKKDIIKMELQMLEVLKFELGRPLPLHFLRRGSKAAHADGRTHMLAKYLCELMLVDYESAHWNPSLLAATALYMSLRLIALERDPSSEAVDNVWTSTVEHYTGYSRADVIKHASVMCRVIVNAESSKYQNCRKKYLAAKFMEISKLPQFSSKLVKRLAAQTAK